MLALGVYYYPEHWPEAMWENDAARLRALGLRYVRIGEFAWSRMEPAWDQFDFGWLDRAMNVLAGAGLLVVVGTPTATPPKWLMDGHPEIAAIDAEGRPRGFGSRRDASFSSRVWRRGSSRSSRRYGAHPVFEAWQTDNKCG